jgi:hypothetical protein
MAIDTRPLPPRPQQQHPDQYGRRQVPLQTQTKNVQEVAQMAADAVMASANKAAEDVLTAAQACEHIAGMIRKDAEELAAALREQGQAVKDRVNQYGEVSKEIAASFLASRERFIGLASEMAPPSLEKSPTSANGSSRAPGQMDGMGRGAVDLDADGREGG